MGRKLPVTLSTVLVGVVLCVVWITWKSLHTSIGPSNSVSTKEVADATMQISTNISEGHALSASVSQVANQEKNKYLQQVLFQIQNDVSTGYPLSVAMAKYPNVFNEQYVAAAKRGEKSGQLDTELRQQASKDE